MIPILILDTVLGIIAAMAVAYVRGSITDRAIMVITTVMLSISFLVYIIVGQWLFGFYLGWFPVQGWSDSYYNLTYYAVLPVSLAVLFRWRRRRGCTQLLSRRDQPGLRAHRARQGCRRKPRVVHPRAAQRNDSGADDVALQLPVYSSVRS